MYSDNNFFYNSNNHKQQRYNLKIDILFLYEQDFLPEKKSADESHFDERIMGQLWHDNNTIKNETLSANYVEKGKR